MCAKRAFEIHATDSTKQLNTIEGKIKAHFHSFIQLLRNARVTLRVSRSISLSHYVEQLSTSTVNLMQQPHCLHTISRAGPLAHTQHICCCAQELKRDLGDNQTKICLPRLRRLLPHQVDATHCTCLPAFFLC